MAKYKKTRPVVPVGEIARVFGIRSASQLAGDLAHVLRRTGRGFQVGVSSVDFLRPDLSFPAYAGYAPESGMSPIYHLFDRTGGGKGFSQRVTRKTCRDFRGKTLTYDEHDGIDFVCPPGTPLCAAAPGRVAMVRDRWLRGGLTVAVDHGHGLLTQYTHCWKPLLPVGTKVKRGQAVAVSGVAGMDMTTFFPWIPPHIHFMAWDNGRPVDPFLAPGEADRPGAWENENNPKPAAERTGGAVPGPSPVDRSAVDEAVLACADKKIQKELATAAGNYGLLAAILEDALHHDEWAWPAGFRHMQLRPDKGPSPLRLTLPLPAQTYQGAVFSDPAVSLRGFKERLRKSG